MASIFTCICTKVINCRGCLSYFRYKQDLTPEQKEALIDLVKTKVHAEISPEIKREFQNSSCRGEMLMDVEMGN